MALPPTRTSHALNGNMAATSGTNTVVTNYCLNPRAVTSTGWLYQLGTTEASTQTLETGAGPNGLNNFIRRTINTAKTTGNSGFYRNETGAAGASGELWTASVWVRTSAAVNMQLNMTFRVGSTTVNTISGASIAIPANTWTRLTTSNTSTGTFDNIQAWAILPSASIVPVGGTIDTTQMLIMKGYADVPFFDGAVPAAGDFTYAWSGAANASTSYQQGKIVTLAAYSPGTGGTGIAYQSLDVPPDTACTYSLKALQTVSSTAGAAGLQLIPQVSGAAGETLSAMVWVKCSTARTIRLLCRPRNVSTIVGPDITTSVSVPANTWVQVKAEGLVSTGSYTNILVWAWPLSPGNSLVAAGDTLQMAGVVIEKAATIAGPFFDGNTSDPNYVHAWTGAANASTSTRDVYGIWVEQVTGSGAPRVQVTAIGLGTEAVTTQVTRAAGGETWSVPGWKARNTLGGETYTDWTPPLGRPVTYTLISNGQAINSRTITVTSTTGWVQDPLNPESAMPVDTTADGGPAVLALSKAALKRLTYAASYEEETPLGGRYPIIRAQQRQGASGVEFHLNAYSNVTSDALLTLVMDTPIILFRGLPSWGSIPALAYLIGDVEEAPFNRDRGGQFTAWVAGGKLAAPVALGPLTGNVTNQMVQDNLAGRTNASIESTSATKRNIDVQANPLGLGQ